MNKQSSVDLAIENLAEANEISVQEAAKQFLKGSEFVQDLDIKQEHHWTDRGLKLTCESPSHPFHEAWKRRSTV